ncbi:MAG TPA: hypothetical protein VFX45_10825 [Solirubrobacterales bacterium]|nr:hypothetical protein [Solirubrobacterales bacterium]
MRATRSTLAFACLLAVAFLVGCGGDSDTSGSTASSGAAESRPAPPKSAFPTPHGRSLEEVLKFADARSELVVSPAAMVFYKGENRYPFGVFERDRTQVPDAEVALYFAKVPKAKPGAKKGKPGSKGADAQAEANALEETAIGPFPAKIESLATQPAFRAQTTTDDPDAATVVYSTEIDFPSDGEWRIAALIKQGDELSATLLPSAVVGEFSGIPRPGDPAPKMHTPTAGEVGGDLSKITTRIPPDTQNKVDYADALGKEPIVLLFATPQFCESRVCGPVVDVAEQAKQESGDEAAFIHMEIWEDNEPGTKVRPQVRTYKLPTEPWLFTINSKGVVSSATEGAFGLELMDEMLQKAVAEG